MTAQPLNFSDEAHRVGYYVDPTDPYGRKLVGVTTAIGASIPKPYLADWRVKLCAQYVADNAGYLEGLDHGECVAAVKKGGAALADYAANKGTIVHRVMELAVTGGIADAVWDGDCTGHVNAGLAFLDDYRPQIIWTEATVFYPEQGYAGTLDLLAIIDGEVWALDYKTGSKLSDEAGLQLAAIRNAPYGVYGRGATAPPGTWLTYHRVPVPAIDRCGAVHLRDNGKYTLRETAADDGLFRTFLSSVELWRFQQRKDVLGEKVAPPERTPEAELAETFTDEAVLADIRQEAGTIEATAELAADKVMSEPTPLPSISPIGQWHELRERAIVVLGCDGGEAALQALWPLNVPRFSECDSYTPEQAEAVEHAVSAAESQVYAPFPGADTPPTPRPRPPIPEIIEPTYVAGDDPRVAALQADFEALPADLIDDIVARYVTSGKVPSLSSGKAAEEQLAEVQAAVKDAGHVTRHRRGLMASIFDDLKAANVNPTPFAMATLPQLSPDATGLQVKRFGLLADGAFAGFVVVEPADGTLQLTLAAVEQLAAIGKRPAVAAAKRLAPQLGITKFDDLLADLPTVCAVLLSTAAPTVSGTPNSPEENAT